MLSTTKSRLVISICGPEKEEFLGRHMAGKVMCFLSVNKDTKTPHHVNTPINFDPLKLHFYIVKLGFTGVYTIFLILLKKHRLWVLVRTASPRQFSRVPTNYVLSRTMKSIRFFFI